MAHDARRRGGVHAAKLLDRLHEKKQQDQAYNEIHCRKASKLGGVWPAV